MRYGATAARIVFVLGNDSGGERGGDRRGRGGLGISVGSGVSGVDGRGSEGGAAVVATVAVGASAAEKEVAPVAEAEAGPPAVVLLSGGLDSATMLALAVREGFRCHALSFDYGQTHGAELAAARRIAARFDVDHRILTLPIGGLGGSALTDPSIAVPDRGGEGIPVTYVPARNTIFLALALALAEVLEARAIFIGVNALDYSGYPDCRPEFVAAFQQLANLATKQAVEGAPVRIRAPLVDMTKAEIIARGTELGVDYSLTVSCYRADAEGRACGSCDACRFRAQGFSQAGIADPTRYRA